MKKIILTLAVALVFFSCDNDTGGENGVENVKTKDTLVGFWEPPTMRGEGYLITETEIRHYGFLTPDDYNAKISRYSDFHGPYTYTDTTITITLPENSEFTDKIRVWAYEFRSGFLYLDKWTNGVMGSDGGERFAKVTPPKIVD